MAEVQLRPYQIQTLDAVARDFASGYRAVLVVLATGAGKTHCFLEFANQSLALGEARRVLVLAHRLELIEQPHNRIQEYWPHLLPQTGLMIGEVEECDRQITIATVQTFTRGNRLKRLLAHGPIDLVITDEAHHSVAPSYQRVYQTLREVQPRLRHLGVTATPQRGDERGLAEVYETVSARYGLQELVPDWLVPPLWMGIQTDISLRGVHTRADDFVTSELAAVYEGNALWDLIVAVHRQHAPHRPALAFTVSVAGAYALAAKFRAVGIQALAVDGNTPRAIRRDAITALRQGNIEVITNCQLFTEGVDVPEIACVHLARPTHSAMLYQQMVGRGLRYAPGKESCLLIDYTPRETRNVYLLSEVLGVPREQLLLEQEEHVRRPGTMFGRFGYDGTVHNLLNAPQALPPWRLVPLSANNGWGSSDLPRLDSIVPELTDRLDITIRSSQLAWFAFDGWAVLRLGQVIDHTTDAWLVISPRTETLPHWLYALRDDGSYRLVTGAWQLEAVLEVAEQFVSEHGDAEWTERRKPWRKLATREWQRDELKALMHDDPGSSLLLAYAVNRGTTSDVLHWLKARLALRRAGRWLVPDLYDEARTSFSVEALNVTLEEIGLPTMLPSPPALEYARKVVRESIELAHGTISKSEEGVAMKATIAGQVLPLFLQAYENCADAERWASVEAVHRQMIEVDPAFRPWHYGSILLHRLMRRILTGIELSVRSEAHCPAVLQIRLAPNSVDKTKHPRPRTATNLPLVPKSTLLLLLAAYGRTPAQNGWVDLGVLGSQLHILELDKNLLLGFRTLARLITATGDIFKLRDIVLPGNGSQKLVQLDLKRINDPAVTMAYIYGRASQSDGWVKHSALLRQLHNIGQEKFATRFGYETLGDLIQALPEPFESQFRHNENGEAELYLRLRFYDT